MSFFPSNPTAQRQILFQTLVFITLVVIGTFGFFYRVSFREPSLTSPSAEWTHWAQTEEIPPSEPTTFIEFPFEEQSPTPIMSVPLSSTPVAEPITSIPAASSTPYVVDYTDPLDISRKLFYGTRLNYKLIVGPWQAEIPSEVVAGENFHMSFHCVFPEPSLCPQYYTVMFHGPTRQSVPPENFTPSNVTNPPFTYGTIEATWSIDDPGEYFVYAYPDFVYSDMSKALFCREWKTMQFPWNQAAVENTPFRLVVKPTQQREEGYGDCSPDDLKVGRYLSTDASLSSQQFAEMYAHTGRQFVWAPYNCKIPHRRVHEAVQSITSARNILVIGDSTSRGYFCTRIWEGVHGTTKDTLCDYKRHNQTYWDQDIGHKFTWKIFVNESEQRNVSFTFLWSPIWYHNKKAVPVLLALDPPPTHIVFTVGRYCIFFFC